MSDNIFRDINILEWLYVDVEWFRALAMDCWYSSCDEELDSNEELSANDAGWLNWQTADETEQIIYAISVALNGGAENPGEG
jgi:hypothetical protein